MSFAMVRLWLGALVCCFGIAYGALPSLDDDTTCSVPEAEWFCAEQHIPMAMSFARAWTGVRSAHVLDAFGFSERVSKQWGDAGWNALVYDIKHCSQHDLVTESGFYALLDMGLQLVPRGLLVAGPPCSLYVGACISVHQRTMERPEGNTANFKVRLSNRIWRNFAAMLRVLIRAKRAVYLVIEQPSSSFAFKTPWMMGVKALGSLFIVLTWMGYFGHDLQKPTHLLCNMPTTTRLARTMTKSMRKKIKARLKKRNKKRSEPLHYHKKISRPDGTQGWQGSKALPLSAAYTKKFCEALLEAWTKQWFSPDD